jgi:hypothetical protein
VAVRQQQLTVVGILHRRTSHDQRSLQCVGDVGPQEHLATVDRVVDQEGSIVTAALEIADVGAHDLDGAQRL